MDYLKISKSKNELKADDFNYSKIKLFTHTDLDGVGCHIALKVMMPYAKINTEFCDYDNINDKVSKFITGDTSEYDFIYITDLSVDKEVADKINELYSQDILNIALLDHHETALWLNEYDWALVKVKDKINSIIEETSGARMVFDYTVPFPNSNLLGFESIHSTNLKIHLIENFVEIVRKYDTWLWKNKYNNTEPKKYNDLLYLIGRENFINNITHKINKSSGEFYMKLSEKDKFILELEQEKINRYIDSKEKSMNLFNKFDHVFGVVFAEQYTNEIGDTLSERNPDLDFIMIVNPNNFKISLRTIRDNVKVNDFAKKFGGGGHDKAAGFNLDYDSKHFKKIVLGLMEISETND